jgi:hypothetical protein
VDLKTSRIHQPAWFGGERGRTGTDSDGFDPSVNSCPSGVWVRTTYSVCRNKSVSFRTVARCVSQRKTLTATLLLVFWSRLVTVNPAGQRKTREARIRRQSAAKPSVYRHAHTSGQVAFGILAVAAHVLYLR